MTRLACAGFSLTIKPAERSNKTSGNKYYLAEFSYKVFTGGRGSAGAGSCSWDSALAGGYFNGGCSGGVAGELFAS